MSLLKRDSGSGIGGTSSPFKLGIKMYEKLMLFFYAVRSIFIQVETPPTPKTVQWADLGELVTVGRIIWEKSLILALCGELGKHTTSGMPGFLKAPGAIA